MPIKHDARTISRDDAAFAVGRSSSDLHNWKPLIGPGELRGRWCFYSRAEILAGIAPLAHLVGYGLPIRDARRWPRLASACRRWRRRMIEGAMWSKAKA